MSRQGVPKEYHSKLSFQRSVPWVDAEMEEKQSIKNDRSPIKMIERKRKTLIEPHLCRIPTMSVKPLKFLLLLILHWVSGKRMKQSEFFQGQQLLGESTKVHSPLSTDKVSGGDHAVRSKRTKAQSWTNSGVALVLGDPEW